MAINRVLADISVKDLTAARTWYERLLGRPADAMPMEGLVVWDLTESGGVQLFHDEDRAGSSSVTLVVRSLDDQLAALKAAGIPIGPMQGTPGLVRVATVTDPEGNQLNFAESLADRS